MDQFDETLAEEEQHPADSAPEAAEAGGEKSAPEGKKKKRRKEIRERKAAWEHERFKPWQKWRHSTGLFALVCVYIEVCLHFCVYRSIDSRIIYPILFGLLAGTVMSLICAGLPRIPGRILTVACIVAADIYAEVQLVYHAIFGNFMPISQAQMGEGVVTNFGSQILYGIGKNIGWIILLALPIFLIAALLILGRAPRRRVGWKQSLASLGLVCVLSVAVVAFMMAGSSETFSVYEIFTNVNTSTDTSYKNLGMFASTGQEIRYMISGTQGENGDINEVYMGRTVSGLVYSSDKYNVLDIDFNALAESTEDEDLKAMDQYFATVIPTRKNDYTGMLSDYNLITICAESFCPYFVSEELTPALYKMMNTGIIFENYYGTFQSVTTNGEYTMCMGLYPDMSRTKTQSSFDLSSSNYLPFCLGNALKSKGYQTWAYHNYIGEFYNRSLTHPNMGYTFKAADSGLDIQVDWPSSDLEMMEKSVDDYLDSGAPFHAYYMTFSGHYQYNWENAMSRKNQAAVEDLDYSETVKAYIACNLELEYAMEYLLERLEEAGVADKTCIVITNDHYPYGLTEEEYNELAGEEIDTQFEKYRNSFICYVPGLREDIYVEEYCSTADILPTLLNLFGVDYDSRLLMGTDVFSDGTHLAVLSDQSFITDNFRYDSSLEEAYANDPEEEVSQDVLDSYRLYVSNKFVLSTDILNLDYYAHVYGKESDSGELEDTVVFTDITNIFNQASVLYMYRNGYVDPESEDTFGGRQAAKMGEFVDVLYRITGCPDYDESALPERYLTDDFNAENQYYAAVCWAWEIGLLHDDDIDDEWNDTCDYRTACILMKRYADYRGLDTSVDEALVQETLEEHSRMSDEIARSLLWADDRNLTTRSVELEDLLSGYSTRISRYQMTSFLFYLCTYELGMEG